MANEQAQAFIDQATQSLQNSQFQQALDLVDQAIAIEPSVSDTHVLRGICLSQLGQPDAASEAFRKAIMISPYNSKAYYNLAVHLNTQGKKKEALELAREAVGVDPRHSSARQLLQQLEAELMGEPQGPAGSNTSQPVSNDPLASPTAPPPPSGMGTPPPTTTTTAPGGVIEPNLPPRTPPPSAPGAPGSPAGVQSPTVSPYSSGYQRGGYVESVHNLGWVESMGPAWTMIGWFLTGLSFLMMLVWMGSAWTNIMAAMNGHPNYAGAGTPLVYIGMFVNLLAVLWAVFDIIDRKPSAVWTVFIVILSCCCGLPWIILPFYIGLGRKASN